MSAAAPATTVVVTRPAAQAGSWVDTLRARGLDAVALPLIDIVPATDPDALAEAWASLPARRLVFFVSGNAVLHFFAARPEAAAWPEALAAAAPGAGTADALRVAGLAEASIVAPGAGALQFDSEALWQRLQGRDWRDASVLVVRGGRGRDWLAERLIEAGARVDTVTAYQRALPIFDSAGQARLDELAASSAVVWLFSSSEAIGHLEQVAGCGRWSAARAIVTHPRIGARARQAGFGRVVEAGPGLDAVVACIQSMEL